MSTVIYIYTSFMPFRLIDIYLFFNILMCYYLLLNQQQQQQQQQRMKKKS
jgi:hypothetical protein